MKSTEVRNLTWQEIQGSLHGTREIVHAWLLAHGPATTATIAAGCSLGLLTVRPRVSELCAWGFAACVGRESSGGIYEARTVAQAQAVHDASRAEAQLNLLYS